MSFIHVCSCGCVHMCMLTQCAGIPTHVGEIEAHIRYNCSHLTESGGHQLNSPYWYVSWRDPPVSVVLSLQSWVLQLCATASSFEIGAGVSNSSPYSHNAKILLTVIFPHLKACIKESHQSCFEHDCMVQRCPVTKKKMCDLVMHWQLMVI